jgi:thioesterase domain-containing protein
MAVESTAVGPAGDYVRSRRELGIATRVGLSALDRILADDSAVVAVSSVPVESGEPGIRRPPIVALPKLMSRHPRPSNMGPAVVPVGTIETRMQGIWCDVLALDEVGATDDFFELGGTSLQAIQLARVIANELNQQVSSAMLIQNPSVRSLSAALGGRADPGSANSIDDRLVEFGQRRAAAAIHLVHPIGGQVFAYRDLAAELGRTLDVIAFRSTVTPESDSVVDLARSYLALASERGERPRALGGASFGGMVAFEMACQMQEAGDPPRLLIMLDTPGPDDVAGLYGDDTKLLEYLAFQMPDFAWLRPIVTGSTTVALRSMLERIGDSGLAQHLRRLAADTSAMRAYKPRAYHGRVLFIKAHRRRPGVDPDNPEHCWLRHASALECVEVGGDHVSMLLHPDVTGVADQIRIAFADSDIPRQ